MFTHSCIHRRTQSIRGAVLTVALVLTLTACTTAPRTGWQAAVTDTVPDPSPDAMGIIVMVHGLNASAESWPQRYEDRFLQIPGAGRWDILRVNWAPVSARFLTAPGRGYALGRALGRELAEAGDAYRVIHLVGQSLGAHVIHGLSEAYREYLPAGETAAYVHMTFLDPFIARSILRPSYGRRHFGRYADFAESYFTRREPVWFTNSPLRQAVNFDLTEVVPTPDEPEFTHYHDYPHHYYQATIGSHPAGPGFPLAPLALGAHNGGYVPRLLREVLPAGSVVEAPSPRNVGTK